MPQHRVSADDAFAMLVSASQDTNMKLAAVADRVVETMVTTSAPGSADPGLTA